MIKKEEVNLSYIKEKNMPYKSMGLNHVKICDATTGKEIRFCNGFGTLSIEYPKIMNVIFHDPATIVYWEDGDKTVVKCGADDVFDPEKGLAMAIAKKVLGKRFHSEFREWTSEYYKD